MMFHMKQSDEMDIVEWIAYGVERGFCSEASCSMHDGIEMSEQEQKDLDEGWDPCIYALRLFSPS